MYTHASKHKNNKIKFKKQQTRLLKTKRLMSEIKDKTQ
jgi:hypothetical protein